MRVACELIAEWSVVGELVKYEKITLNLKYFTLWFHVKKIKSYTIYDHEVYLFSDTVRLIIFYITWLHFYYIIRCYAFNFIDKKRILKASSWNISSWKTYKHNFFCMNFNFLISTNFLQFEDCWQYTSLERPPKLIKQVYSTLVLIILHLFYTLCLANALIILCTFFKYDVLLH